jgi:hypothetical protein
MPEKPLAKQTFLDAMLADTGAPATATPAVNTSTNAGNQDAELDRLRRHYPRWRIWRGRATSQYWALPPPDHPRRTPADQRQRHR